ncbi:MAG: helix-turn-helix transcriptional regulator [Lentilitoribacter sp.]
MKQNEPHKVDIAVGGNLRILRQQRGFTQSELGEVLGITFQQIQKYEKGSNRISASKLYEIAEFFGVCVSSFFEGCGDKKQTTGIYQLNKDAIDVAFAMDNIADPKLRKQIKQLVIAISE